MAELKIVGKKGSKAVKNLVEATGIRRYLGQSSATDAIINYGLAGPRLEEFFRKYPSARKVNMINANAGRSKLSAISVAERAGLLVPDTKISLGFRDSKKDFIEKRVHSIGGKGIKMARGKGRVDGYYYQRLIDRKYELRVHAFSWTEDWAVQKRISTTGEIAWNFSNGGTFQNVREPSKYKVFSTAIAMSKKILSAMNMSFGAVDFLVGKDGEVYFIEINSAPGFTEFSQGIYVGAINSLKRLTARQVGRLQ